MEAARRSQVGGDGGLGQGGSSRRDVKCVGSEQILNRGKRIG